MAFTSEPLDETLARRTRATAQFPEMQYSTPTQIAEVDGAYPDRLPTSFTQQAVRLANYASEPPPDQPDNAPNVLPWTTRGPLSGSRQPSTAPYGASYDEGYQPATGEVSSGAGDNGRTPIQNIGSFAGGLVGWGALDPSLQPDSDAPLSAQMRAGQRMTIEQALNSNIPAGGNSLAPLFERGATSVLDEVVPPVARTAKTWMELANQALDDVRGAEAKVAEASQIGRAPNTDSLFTAGPQGEVVGPTGNVAELRLGREPVMGEDVNAGLRRTAYGRAQQEQLAAEEQAAFRDAGERAISGAVPDGGTPPLGGGSGASDAEFARLTAQADAEKAATGAVSAETHDALMNLLGERIGAIPTAEQAAAREAFYRDHANLGGGQGLTPEAQQATEDLVKRADQKNTITDALAAAREPDPFARFETPNPDTLPEPNRTQPPPGYLERFRQPPAGGADIPGSQPPLTPRSSVTSQAADRAATDQYAKAIRDLPNTKDEQEVVKLWHAGNRAILDSIKNDRPLGISVESAIAGDLPDSFVSSALHRKATLRAALEQSGAPENIVKQATDDAFNRELAIHYGGAGKVPEDVKAMIARTRSGNGASGDEMSTLDTLIQRAKNTMFGLADFGVLGGQVHNLARRGGIPLIEASINHTLAALNLPHIATEIADSNLPKTLQYALDGVHQGIGPASARPEVGTLLSYLGKYGKAVDRKYVIPASDAMTKVQFQNILTPLRNLTYEGDLITLRLAGRDIQNPLVRHQAAANANVLSSFAESALNAGRRSFEGKAFTSSSMTRSKVRQITQMAKLISPRATPEQRILAAATIASTFVLYSTVAKFLNDQIGTTPMQFDPSKPGYGVITTNVRDKEGRRLQIDVVPSDAVDRAFAQSIRALADPNIDNIEAQRAWERVGIGAGSILTRGALAIGTRTGYEPGKGYRYGNLSGSGIVQSVLPTPPTLQNLTQGASPLEQGLGAVGVSSYPENVPAGSGARPTRPASPVRPTRPQR